jgi:hypothetical protein
MRVKIKTTAYWDVMSVLSLTGANFGGNMLQSSRVNWNNMDGPKVWSYFLEDKKFHRLHLLVLILYKRS